MVIIFEKLMVTELVRKLPSLILFQVTYYLSISFSCVFMRMKDQFQYLCKTI